jgi:hypothetical protein
MVVLISVGMILWGSVQVLSVFMDEVPRRMRPVVILLGTDTKSAPVIKRVLSFGVGLGLAVTGSILFVTTID